MASIVHAGSGLGFPFAVGIEDDVASPPPAAVAAAGRILFWEGPSVASNGTADASNDAGDGEGGAPGATGETPGDDERATPRCDAGRAPEPPGDNAGEAEAFRPAKVSAKRNQN